MDTKGLLTFVTKNRENMTVLCEELSNALKSSIEPAHLILDSLDGFYPLIRNIIRISQPYSACENPVLTL